MLEIFPLEHIYLRFDLFYISNIVSKYWFLKELWNVSEYAQLEEIGQSGQPIIGTSLLERNGPHTYKPKLNFNG